MKLKSCPLILVIHDWPVHPWKSNDGRAASLIPSNSVEKQVPPIHLSLVWPNFFLGCSNDVDVTRTASGGGDEIWYVIRLARAFDVQWKLQKVPTSPPSRLIPSPHTQWLHQADPPLASRLPSRTPPHRALPSVHSPPEPPNHAYFVHIYTMACRSRHL